MRPALACGALAALLALGGCARDEAPPHEDVRPVRSLVVGPGNAAVGATYSGTIVARHESKLGFRTSGKVIERLVEVGTPVRRGQPLMRLDPAQESLHVTAASADVDAARHRLEQNRSELQRTEALHARSYASQAELDQQRLALQQSESQLQSALAQSQLRVNQRGWTTLVADRDGVVTAIGAETGQVVSPGQPVVTVAADGEREVLVGIPEGRIDELRRARELRVSIWAQPGRSWAGRLRELSPDADSVTRTYAARIGVIDPDDGLRLGMTASVHAADIDGRAAIRVPLTAVRDRAGLPHVWVVDAATTKVGLRAVALGPVHGDSVLVMDGLRGGEVVVTAGVHQLHEGQRVKAVGGAVGASL